MKIRITILFFLLCVGYSIEAQRCGTDEYHEMLYKSNPALEGIVANGYAQKIAAIKNTQQKASSYRTVYIPVVVHLIGDHTISEVGSNNYQRVYDQLRILNEDFRKKQGTNGDGFGDGYTSAEDTEIEFCLANTDEYGRATTGITETHGNYDHFDVNIEGYRSNSNLFLKSLIHWNEHKYLNLYVVKEIISVYRGDTYRVLGYSSIPEELFELGGNDGVVINEKYFGFTDHSRYGKGRTTTHEVGHWLGLQHTWGSNLLSGSGSCSDDDLIEDTPVCYDKYYSEYSKGCPSLEQCMNENWDVGLPAKRQIENYMDYSDDLCMSMFTNGQKELMRRTLVSDRYQLAESSPELVGCSGPEHCNNNYYEPLDGETGVDCGGECDDICGDDGGGNPGGGGGGSGGRPNDDYCYENHLDLDIFHPRKKDAKGNLFVDDFNIYERQSFESYRFVQKTEGVYFPYTTRMVKIINNNKFVILKSGVGKIVLDVYSRNSDGNWFMSGDKEINGGIKFTSENIYILKEKNNNLEVLKYSIDENSTRFVGRLPIKYAGEIKYMSDSVIYSVTKEGDVHSNDSFYEFKTMDNWATHAVKKIVDSNHANGIAGIYNYKDKLVVCGSASPITIYEENNGNWAPVQTIDYSTAQEVVFITDDIFMAINSSGNNRSVATFYEERLGTFSSIDLTHLGASTIEEVNGSIYPYSLLSDEEIVINRELNEIIADGKALKLSEVLQINASEIIADPNQYKKNIVVDNVMGSSLVEGDNIYIGDGVEILNFADVNKTFVASNEIIFKAGVSFKNSKIKATITRTDYTSYKNCTFTENCSSTASKVASEEESYKGEIVERSSLLKVDEDRNKIYPNPNNGIFYIEKYEDIQNLKIFSNIGIPVYEQNNFVDNQIDVSHLSKADYFLMLQLKDGTQSKVQLVIQK